jgi:hypothetical protein
MAGSAARHAHGGFGWIAYSCRRFSRHKAILAPLPWALCAGWGWRGAYRRPAWPWGALRPIVFARYHAALPGWQRLAVWPVRALWHSRHSDVAKSRQTFQRGCGEHAEMIIVRQGLEAMDARIGCWGFPSCRGQGPRINAGCSGNEEDLNA